MSSTLLANELTTLASDARRKNNELRNAAEKSLQDLKSLPSTSEQQLAADLCRRPTFVEPFLLACETQNAKFAASGISCLQRLVVSRGLPKARLKDALESFNACTSLGHDIQLKILQALPSLLQNYTEDLNGDLLSEVLQVCFALQNAKSPTVSGVAAATLQQLVTSVFEKVSYEDKHTIDSSPTNEVPGDDAPIMLRPAAFDAYRVFRDLALAAENRQTNFMHSASLSQESSLELIWSCMSANVQLFKSHPELGNIIRSNVLPSVTHALSEKAGFPLALRSLRVLDIILTRFFGELSSECEVALGLATQSLDAEAAPLWKRALVMEILRNFLTDGGRIIDAYSAYDMENEGKPVVQDLLAAFVKVSSEKPATIGLGQQSTVPLGPAVLNDTSSEQVSVEAASSVAGIIGSALGVAEQNVTGINSQWSLPRSAFLEQLDKTEPPTIPETYIYAILLDCISSFSESLAKVILPLTIETDKQKRKHKDEQPGTTQEIQCQNPTRTRSISKRAVPINPLEMENHRLSKRVKAVNGIIESCWPAVLATSSVFLNAALDDHYYRNLIRSCQRVAQVAGLLRLRTARDALMTTLSKGAVPPHVLSAAISDATRTPVTESPRRFSNPKSLLNMESLVSQTSTLSDHSRRSSFEPNRPMLTARNLLCLRALLNLAIALGPILDTAFRLVVTTLRHADVVLCATPPQQMMRQTSKTADSNPVQAFSNEVAAVEAAASRLLESTADYPDEAFVNVLETFCRFLHSHHSSAERTTKSAQSSPSLRPSLSSKDGTLSGLQTSIGLYEGHGAHYQFVIPKLGHLCDLNINRFTAGNPTESGWILLVDELIDIARSNSTATEPRRAATAVLCNLAVAAVGEVADSDEDERAVVQRRSLSVLLQLIDSIHAADEEPTHSDIDVHGRVVDSLRDMLEQYGDSLVAGWHLTAAILGSVFERDGSHPVRHDEEEAHIDWSQMSAELVSVPLGRAAFVATQLICSDFLSAVSNSVVPSLIELLHRFATQDDDLNIALTTITIAWNVSDHLLHGFSREDLDSAAVIISQKDRFDEGVEAIAHESTPSQWLLLMLRMQRIVKISQKEVQKAAFQTFCSILKNNGEQMSPRTWDVTLRNILLAILLHDVKSYHSQENEDSDEEGPQTVDESMSAAIIDGTSGVISQFVHQVEQSPNLPGLWEAFLGRQEAYLDLERPVLHAAVYQALSQVISRVTLGSTVWSGPLYRTLALWLKCSPVNIESAHRDSNEEALIAYVEAANEIYRLTKQNMSTSQTRSFVENLYTAVRYADGPRYGADINIMSSLQTKSLELLKQVQTDDVSTLVVVAAKMAMLYEDTAAERSRKDGPTFVALASGAIDWLQSLLHARSQDLDFLDTHACVSAIQKLRRIVEQKYSFRLESKGTPLWQRARDAALALSKPILEQCCTQKLNQATKITIISEYVNIATGIVQAQGLHNITSAARISTDEETDIAAFKSLCEILVPHLGDPDVPASVLETYARALFQASLVHAPETSELPSDPSASPLTDLQTIRRGRVRRVLPSQRERMSYTCFRELLVLAQRSDSSAASVRLVQASLPLLILRLAIPIRAYIADQPLRGAKPQPLSEVEELLFCFNAIGDLNCEPQGLEGAIEGADSDIWGRKVHLRFVYPLLVKAVRTAADKWSGNEEILEPLRELLERLKFSE